MLSLRDLEEIAVAHPQVETGGY